jgi:hypothetical protein
MTNAPTQFIRPREVILKDVRGLIVMHRCGQLGGAFMPEDNNPAWPKGSDDAWHYFTLPMALNYQRNSYKLWEAARATALDKDTVFVFTPTIVSETPLEKVRAALLKYKLALQPNKHIDTWVRLCRAFVELGGGSVRNILRAQGSDIVKIKAVIQSEHKKDFPYLSGQKICNYWLHVLSMYTDFEPVNRGQISVAADTHVIQASVRLGVVPAEITAKNDVRERVAEAWQALLDGTGILPIDIHTALWLWSRGGFIPINL